MRSYFVLFGLVAILGSRRFSRMATRRWGEILHREPKGMELGYRIAMILGGVLFVVYGLAWPPGWQH